MKIVDSQKQASPEILYLHYNQHICSGEKQESYGKLFTIKLVVTSATLVVTGALLVVTKKLLITESSQSRC